MALPVVNLRVSVLVAPIATPLYEQMAAEGRLFIDGTETSFPGGDLWTNIEPRQMTRRQLAEGAIWLVEALHEPDNAIRRFEHLAAILGPPPEHLRASDRKVTPGKGAFGIFKLFRQAASDPQARRVIDAVNEMSHQRPEIARDLSFALSIFLNSFTSLHRLSQQGSRQVHLSREKPIAQPA
jgi:hypothetical protein